MAESKKVMINVNKMKQHGCSSCVLRMISHCPHGITKGKEYSFDYFGKPQAGWCVEYMEYILSFAEEGDSESTMWEKFYLSIPQAMLGKDSLDYSELVKEIDELKIMNPQSSMLPALEARRDALKFWVSQLSFNIQKAFGRMSDREQRRDTGLQLGPQKISLTQIHNIMNYTPKEIEQKGEKDGKE